MNAMDKLFMFIVGFLIVFYLIMSSYRLECIEKAITEIAPKVHYQVDVQPCGTVVIKECGE